MLSNLISRAFCIQKHKATPTIFEAPEISSIEKSRLFLDIQEKRLEAERIKNRDKVEAFDEAITIIKKYLR